MEITVDSVVGAKSYVGTLKRFANPKTRKYWADVRDGLVIINPEYILSQLKIARERIQSAKNEGKDILLVSDKVIFRDEIKDICESQGIHYMNNNVPSGVFTNFDTLKSRINSMLELSAFVESSDFATLSKKEKQQTIKKLNKLKLIYSGVKNLKKSPDFAIVLDGVALSSFVKEIEILGLDNVILSSTDFDKYWDSSSLVVSNITSYGSVKFVIEYLLKK
ncbi:30S ribosomal protein S2 [Candidatus Vampirococcus lugosii]|uniref:Small ribosomal subunit protein uS2 n=1 Tax=Candidatus Vampirococcus lugosii TaxID=2789015 RepID=A0ABS5QKN5_9BACT|nr:30S ribosomal protein S2 [Candidatus Vampirococcus lugosii]MBS8121798.1 30S ribosomal protein S2 [Candidatus Vampirococcus lugosii]